MKRRLAARAAIVIEKPTGSNRPAPQQLLVAVFSQRLLNGRFHTSCNRGGSTQVATLFL